MAGKGDISMLLELGIANAFGSTLFDRELERRGVKPAQAGLLDFIARMEPVTPTALEQEMGIPGATLRARVKSLIDVGYVERSPNPADARSFFLITTPEGRGFLEVAHAAVDEAERMLDKELGWSFEDLRGKIREVRQAGQRLLLADDPEALSKISPTPPEGDS